MSPPSSRTAALQDGHGITRSVLRKIYRNSGAILSISLNCPYFAIFSQAMPYHLAILSRTLHQIWPIPSINGNGKGQASEIEPTGLGSTLRSKPLSCLDGYGFGATPIYTSTSWQLVPEFTSGSTTCQGINLRRNDGSALSMKNLREPMGMVMKVSGEVWPA